MDKPIGYSMGLEFRKYITGDVDIIFQALLELGCVHEVLSLDWNKVLSEMRECPTEKYKEGLYIVNSNQRSVAQLVEALKNLDKEVLWFIAVEIGLELTLSQFPQKMMYH